MVPVNKTCNEKETKADGIRVERTNLQLQMGEKNHISLLPSSGGGDVAHHFILFYFLIFCDADC